MTDRLKAFEKKIHSTLLIDFHNNSHFTGNFPEKNKQKNFSEICEKFGNISSLDFKSNEMKKKQHLFCTA